MTSVPCIRLITTVHQPLQCVQNAATVVKNEKCNVLEVERTDRCCSETESVTAQICSGRNRTQLRTQICAAFALRRTRGFNRTRTSDSVNTPRLPVSTRSTKDRRYQHAIYLVVCGTWAIEGKLYCPVNDCSCEWITLAEATSVIYYQQETTKRRR